jgi:hypothetical protein
VVVCMYNMNGSEKCQRNQGISSMQSPCHVRT